MFKVLRTDDANLTRVQQNVQAAFSALDTNSTPTVENITKSMLLSDSTDVLLVNSQAGPVTITLPSTRKKQIIIINGGKGSAAVTLSGNISAGSGTNLQPRYAATLMPIDGTYYYVSRYPVA